MINKSKRVALLLSTNRNYRKLPCRLRGMNLFHFYNDLQKMYFIHTCSTKLMNVQIRLCECRYVQLNIRKIASTYLCMKYVAAFVVSSIAGNIDRLSKPFNPLLGETYEFTRWVTANSVSLTRYLLFQLILAMIYLFVISRNKLVITHLLVRLYVIQKMEGLDGNSMEVFYRKQNSQLKIWKWIQKDCWHWNWNGNL